MALRDRVFARFHPVATGALRLDPESADAFASHLANANAGLHVIGQLCTGPNALASATLDAMLERWFRLLPEYDPPRRALELRPGPAATVPAIDAVQSLMLHARVLEVGLSQRRLAPAQALQVADALRDAVAAFWLLEQASGSTERTSQRALCGVLRAALSTPLLRANDAAAIYLAGS